MAGPFDDEDENDDEIQVNGTGDDLDSDQDEMPDLEDYTKRCAIAAWNTRARPAMPEGMREAVARIIDPVPWQVHRQSLRPPMDEMVEREKASALSMADEILALIAGGEG